ncbi:DUF908 domain protein, partial [Rhizoctonia solani 123E]
MSDEEEENGVIIVKRPSHRSSLVNSLFDAILASETRKRLKTRPGFVVKPRQIQFIEAPVPQLERSNDKSKTTVQIAAWALAKGWKEQTSANFLKAAHLINTTSSLKPDISAFLAQNPILSGAELSGNNVKIEKVNRPIDKAGSSSDPRPDDGEQGQDEGGEYDGAYGIRAQSHDLINSPVLVTPPPSLSVADAEASIVPHDYKTIEIPIDPQLPGANSHSHSEVIITTFQDNTAPVPSSELSVHTATPIPIRELSNLGAIPAVISTYAEYSPSAPSMPPPPLLQPVVEASQRIPIDEEKSKPLQRSGRATKKADPSSNTGIGAIETSEPNTSIGETGYTELGAGFGETVRLNALLATSDLDVLIAVLQLLLRPSQQYSSQPPTPHSLDISAPRLQALAMRWPGLREAGIKLHELLDKPAQLISVAPKAKAPETSIRFGFGANSSGFATPTQVTTGASTPRAGIPSSGIVPNSRDVTFQFYRKSVSATQTQQSKPEPLNVEETRHLDHGASDGDDRSPINGSGSPKDDTQIVAEAVQKYEIPDEEVFELLCRAQIARILGPNQESAREKLVCAQLLAIAIFEPPAQQQLFLSEPDLTQHLAELIHQDRNVPVSVRVAGVNALDGIARYCHRSTEVLTTVNANVRHGILMGSLCRAVEEAVKPS